jgi:hypothetical protein
MDLHPDWKEFIELLNSHGVEYVVVGAYAVAFYTTPRSTADIDFVTRRSEDNAARLEAAIREFGIQLEAGARAKLLRENFMIQIGVAPDRIDILTSIDGVDTDELYRDRVARLGGLPVSFPSKGHLIAAKRALGRRKDLADLDRLIEP